MLQHQINFTATRSDKSCPILLIDTKNFANLTLDSSKTSWMKVNGFTGKAGQMLFVPHETGQLKQVLFGLGDQENPFITGLLPKNLPTGHWHLEGTTSNEMNTYLGLAFGSYQFNRYRQKSPSKSLSIHVHNAIDLDELKRIYETVFWVRDLINTPANDMDPNTLEITTRQLGQTYNAHVTSICGDDLLVQNFPMIHAVGRASNIAPRLIELQWGQENHPKITLVGKGVTFDSGGLDIKSANNMLLMKKDMGGSAHVLGLAKLIMDAKLPFCLRVLIPAVENAISANAFRPGDILQSRKGLTVEVGNTDAEGRLILADALTYGDEKNPQFMICMATLTGAARIALGPDLPAFYCSNPIWAQKISQSANSITDPLWQMPLWKPYRQMLSSQIADINNTSGNNFAGSITAALFLNSFVEKAEKFAHFDLYGWSPKETPGYPVGGTAQAIRALYKLFKDQI
ncbi:leucyl aminopeptidase [Bartonella sp. CDC_skunk]|uniref:leucyl aminopeptidase family protein n=1 Tax=unclassified Bartonella TaxID=2645622 RepID=UPI000998F074|nr:MULTISPECIES: leucyl aminopeptidase family protein [unclassified Bartonella]AQX20788.1 leucyl aminopeptidase [Bartonella sp. CDC_skunk]AQX26042.1 leucyl aminopeptidase [Bartonella sp. Raccoon60]